MNVSKAAEQQRQIICHLPEKHPLYFIIDHSLGDGLPTVVVP